MNLFRNFGRLGRITLAIVLLLTAVNYVQDSLFDVQVVTLAKRIQGEFSIQLDAMGFTLALNDSTFMLKVEV